MNGQQSYREAAVKVASPVELVVRLYEQMVEDLRQVAIAIARKDIELRSNRIKHAIIVVGHLQSSLNFDLGGAVAKDLDTFYNTLRDNLVALQFQPSHRGVAQLITDVLAVRAAWVEVERAERNAAETPVRKVDFRIDAAADVLAPPSRMDWNG